MKHMWKFRNIAAIALTLVLLTGCSMLPEEEAALAPPLIQPTEVTYETAEAFLGDIKQELSDTCSVVPSKQYILSFGEQSGTLHSKEVSVGDVVEKGQVLARLDSGDTEAQLATAEINLAIQKVNLERALAKGLPDVDKNGNAVNFDAQIAQLQIEQIQLNIDGYRKKIEATTIYAPARGVVSSMTSSAVGDNISSRATVCQISDLSGLVFEYVGSKADQLKFGMELTLTVDGEEYSGKVTATRDSVSEEEKKNFDKRAQITPDVDLPLTLGQTVRFKVVVAEKSDAVLVPRSAVVTSSSASYVKVYQDGLVTERSVEIGMIGSEHIEITKGISVGETVVV